MDGRAMPRTVALLLIVCLAMAPLAACGTHPPVNVEANGAPGHTDWKIGLPF